MEKKFRLLDATTPSAKKKRVVNWDLCIICQTDTTESLTCPANKTRGGEGYETLSSDLEKFNTAGLLPIEVNFEGFAEGSLLDNLKTHSAKFHKNCRARYTNYKFNRHSATKTRATENMSTEGACSSYSRFTRSQGGAANFRPECFFCEKEDTTSVLHKVSTEEMSKKVHSIATALNDLKILAKLSEGDMVAIEAQYHIVCLNRFYHRKRSADRKTTNVSNTDKELFAIALTELVSYIEDAIIDTEEIPVFKLKDLVLLFENRLEQLVGEKQNVHSTRIKEILLKEIPELTAYNKGRDVLITVKEGMGDAIQKSCEFDADIDIMNSLRIVKKIRSAVLQTASNFCGTFDAACQEKSVPNILLSLIKMILYGANSQQQLDSNARQEALTIAQLVCYNMAHHVPSGKVVRHERCRETPLPVYLSLMLHSRTRKKEVVEKVHDLGLGISYDRVLQISSELGKSASDYYENIGVVCPQNLRGGIFTTGAVDNIDHNPSSTTAIGSFHGTAISLQQHAMSGQDATDRFQKTFQNKSVTKKVSGLPEQYTRVLPVFRNPRAAISVPKYDFPQLTCHGEFAVPQPTNEDWLQKVEAAVQQGTLQSGEFVSWGAFHGNARSKGNENDMHLTTCSLLPMFRDVAHSDAMIAHAMKVTSDALKHLNHHQTPVITCDAPLYAIAKTIQWTQPDKFGEDKYVVMMGGLHLEKAIMGVLGDLLEGSGWCESLIAAGVSSSGRADSFLSVSHITRTRYAHEVTICALSSLRKGAYQRYVEEGDENQPPNTYLDWCANRSSSCPQFAFWNTVMELEDCLLQFLTAIRRSNFAGYVSSLKTIAPWFFSFGHTNYARWLPVHLRDMDNLMSLHPSIHSEFVAGKFTANIGGKLFSAMALDQAHEQCNALVKGDGGAIGLTENEDALRRWMVSGPQVSQLVRDFEEGYVKKSATMEHHECTPTTQVTFFKRVQKLIREMTDMGNPFEENSQDLYNIHTKVVGSQTALADLKNIRERGISQYEDYKQQRLDEQSVTIDAPIRRNKVNLFHSDQTKSQDRASMQLKVAKSDAGLFAKLYIGCQQRGVDIDNFFKFENQPYPPSISDYGSLRKTTKSDLLQCFSALVVYDTDVPVATAAVLDGPAVVHMLPPGDAKTFGEYSGKFVNHILREWAEVDRIDVIWDEYRPDSLKSEARLSRGSGIRRRVESNTAIPKNWKNFLSVDDNKSELFNLLADRLAAYQGKELVTTKGVEVKCSVRNHENLEPCSHEEADTRILLHAKDASQQGHKSIIIRTVDTDVVVLSVAFFEALQVNKLWVAFGVGKNFHYIPVHSIHDVLGVERARALLFFHAFSGCDTTSSFSGYRKKSLWDVFINNPELVPMFKQLSEQPKDISAFAGDLEKFVVLLYDRSSSSSSVNDCRKELFTKKGRSLDRIPPTAAALEQHALRSAYQAGYCWGQCLSPLPNLPDPGKWGWRKVDDKIWKPVWSTLPQATTACKELLRCSCKNCRTRRCKCKAAGLQCTMLCKCSDCENDVLV